MQCNFRNTAGLLIVLGLLSVIQEGCCCGDKWLRYGDHCFRFYPAKLTRYMARLRCLIEGSDLASISNDSVLQFIANHAALEQGDRFWVGLEREPDTGYLHWLDGTPAGNEPWVKRPDMSEYPPESLNFRFSCFAYNGALVVKVSCVERLGLICGHSIPRRRIRDMCNSKVDPVHSFIGEATGNCLFKAPEKSTKDNAEELCQKHNGHFIDIDDMMKDGLTAFYDHQVLTNDGSKYWTGFTWNGTDMFWSFGSVVPKEYPISVIAGNGSCITVQFNFTDILNTHFYQTECSEEAEVVCSKETEELDSEMTAPPNGDHTHEVLQMDSPLLTCPEGYNWKTGRNNRYCYWETSYETEHLSWNDAEAYCQSYGGHLVSFHSVEEEKIGLSFQYGSLSHAYWIGLSLDVETETYKWSDGSSLDYNNWAPGHPNHKDKRLRCVAMDAQEKHWMSSLCGILSWFICKVPKQARHYTAVRPTPAPLEPCEKDVARTKTPYRFQGACYIAVSETYSWHRAKEYCENEGATLVSIHSGDEIGFLLKLLHESAVETNRVWIGLNSFGSDGSFHWTDWSAVDFTFFSENEPNNFLNQEKCCNMYTNNGQWNDENCNAAMGFICKWVDESAATPTVPSTQDPRIGNCKKGWIAHDDRCYFLGGAREKDRVNWTAASSICQKEGGYLTSIRNEKDQAFLSYILQTLRVDAWIGFHDTIQSGRYYWLDNSEVKYTNWAIGEPSFFGIAEDCVRMVYDHLDSGVWKDDDCEQKYGYICQTRKDPELPKPAYETSTNCLQPEGWLKLDSMCFKMFAGNSLSWSEAENACRKEGGHLVSVSDQKVKAAVTYLATEVNQPFFIGLKYKKDTQQISWLNDHPVQLTNWEKNEPGFLEENTCFSSTSEGYWKKTSCEEPMPFLCQITTGKRTKQSQYTGKCPSSSKSWTPGSGSFCYLLEKEKKIDWFTANLVCFRHGTHLVSVHSMSEIQDLKKIMKNDVSSVFMGLMRNKKGGFTWIDDTPMDFVNWEEGEPSNAEDQCVEMMADTLKWRVTNCIMKKSYICQDRKDKLVYEDVKSAEFKDEKEPTQMGLSTPAICAIVVSLLVGIVLLAAALFYHQKYSRKSQFKRHVPDHSISFENALYKVGSANMEFHDERRDSL